MTSIIKVDQIQNASGGVPTAADLGLNVSGAIVGFASYQSGSTAGEWVTTSTTYSSTGFSLTYTPKFANSTLFVTCVFNIGNQGTVASAGSRWMIYRDGNQFTNSPAADCFRYNSTYGNVNSHGTGVISAAVTSGNTSPTTFTIYGAVFGAGNAKFNYDWGNNTFTVYEIAG